MDLDPGTVVANRYRIGRPLGRGGMGEVFAAENIRTGRPVAIKLLRQDSKQKSSAVARFRQEARAAGSINSDHVTQVLDVEEDAEHGVVLVFELLEGESLIDRLKKSGPIPFDELHPIIEQVWLGLADAHRVGIIHRDLKPSNVFLERRPDGITRVKILDFGISKVPKEVGGETLTEMGQSLGTFSFMPPEQIGKAKTVDHRADIYACATLIFQSLTGQLPYAARNILLMVEAKSKADARKLGEVMAGPIDPRLDAFVARGLSRDPALRFQSALEALAAWRELRPAPSSGSQRPPSVRPVATPASFGSGPAASLLGTPRPGSAPQIYEAPVKLPSVADMTTEESVATLAMPRAQLAGKPLSTSQAPRLSPRLDSAAAAAQGPQVSILNARGVGPGGTQLVMVQRPSSSAGTGLKLRPQDAGATPLPPSASAQLPRAESAPGVPRIYDDPPSPPPDVNDADGVATRVYRPTGDTSGRYHLDPSLQAQLPPPPPPPPPPPHTASAPPPPNPLVATGPRPALAPPRRQQMPVWMVLVGFLVIGFVAVAGVLWLLKGP